MLNFERELRNLRDLADPAPEATERAVLEAFRRRRRSPTPWRLAAAAVLLAACGAWLWFANRPADSGERAAAAPPTEHATDFIVLDPLAPGVRDGHGRLVRIPLPPGEGFGGIPAPWPAAPGATVRAEVLVGDDGAAHAVRFVY